MTIEEAIEVIEQDIPCEHDRDLIEALDMAISALSAEGEYIKKTDIFNELGDVNMDILTDEVKEIVNGLQTYTFPDSAENTGEWIPVSERLPEKNVWVLVTVEQNGKRFQEIMRRNNYIEAWTDNIDNYTDEITAWQPLPEPYKVESED